MFPICGLPLCQKLSAIPYDFSHVLLSSRFDNYLKFARLIIKDTSIVACASERVDALSRCVSHLRDEWEVMIVMNIVRQLMPMHETANAQNFAS